ncbi:hypothetical protein DH86_00001726 [Scytalidium sp. 3C]|nr:hypothetical protein DH86_00001726 [Scytalidium sp. 3C]
MSSASTATPEQLAELKKYTSCDISDALLRLKVPNSGFIADLHLFPSSTPLASPPSFDSVTVAPASTFLFIPKTLDAQDKSHGLPEGNIPSDSYWVDETQPGTIVVMSQPKGQINAVLGGIMAFRMKVRGAKGVVVSGRVRDMGELAQTEMPIWARATSTVGTGFGSVAHAMGIPLDIDGTIVKPGDIVFSDAREGVVVIPQEKLEEVLQLLPRLVKADDAVIESVKNGMPVKEAFAKYRG